MEAGRVKINCSSAREDISAFGLEDVIDSFALSVATHRDLSGRIQVEDLRDDPITRVLWLEAHFVRAHVDRLATEPDCECRNRSSDADGADGFSGDSMSLLVSRR